MDDQIARTTAEDAGLSRRMEVLTSIAGVGRVVAAGLVADMPELGRVDGKAAASLVGVAPWTRESGQCKGRSFIRGGRARPRRLLYMAAVSALRCNPGHGPQVRRAARPRQAAEGRPDGGHAQAGGAGQRAAEAGPAVDAGTRARLNPGPAPGSRRRGGLRPRRRERQATGAEAEGRPHPGTVAGPVAARTERERRRDPRASGLSNETVGQAKWGCATRRKPPLDNMDTHSLVVGQFGRSL